MDRQKAKNYWMPDGSKIERVTSVNGGRDRETAMRALVKELERAQGFDKSPLYTIDRCQILNYDMEDVQKYSDFNWL